MVEVNLNKEDEVNLNKKDGIDEVPGIHIIKFPALKSVQIPFVYLFICCIRVLPKETLTPQDKHMADNVFELDYGLGFVLE